MLHTWQVTRYWSFDTFLRQGYELFTNNSGVPQLFNGTNYTVNYTSYPWGLGAWGAGTASAYRMIDEEARTAFISGANESLNSGRYPQLKLSIYFDSIDDMTGQNCLIGNRTWRPGGDATTTPTVAEGGPSNEPLYQAYVEKNRLDRVGLGRIWCHLFCIGPPVTPKC